jgi:electron transport complex protein RnfD
MVFRIASSPYTHNQRQTSRIMMLVCLAALPGIAVQLWFFGWGTLFQILLGCVSALAAEALVLKLRKMAVSKILADNSALLTGLLLAISIPPFAPWWMVVLGTVFSVIIAKQLYGGLGLEKDGKRLQINSNVLQIENELYAPIRPKRVTRSGETPSDALQRGGIE